MKDIEKPIFQVQNRKKLDWDDDISAIFYLNNIVEKGRVDDLRHSKRRIDDVECDPKIYTKYRCIADIVKMCLKNFNCETNSYKFNDWELIVLDID